MIESVRNRSKMKLNGVEYLCLKMFLNPGQTQRFYRRALDTYLNRLDVRDGKVFHNYVGNAMYFARGGKYRNKLWVDSTVSRKCLAAIPGFDRGSGRGLIYHRPLKSTMNLTSAGVVRARRAAEKIGLKLV